MSECQKLCTAQHNLYDFLFCTSLVYFSGGKICLQLIIVLKILSATWEDKAGGSQTQGHFEELVETLSQIKSQKRGMYIAQW